MKTLINIIILSIISAGGYFFYQQNKDELNKTLNNVKNASVESVSDKVMEKVKSIDTDDLLKLANDNKELIADYISEKDIKIEDISADSLKALMKDNNISTENINIDELKETMIKTLKK